MKKPLKRAKKTTARKKAPVRAKTKTLSQKATAARDIGAGLLAKATDTIKKMVTRETPNDPGSANLMKPADPAHSPGHRRLNVKSAKGHIPTPKVRNLTKHMPVKIPQQ